MDSETTSKFSTARVSLAELANVFLRLSLVAFGGPVAHIALAEQEVVVRRRWVSREHYLDLIAATNLIPGPNSTEVMIHVGYTLRGIVGAIVAGCCFIGPAFALTLALAVLYVSSGTIPQVNALLWGIKPVILAIIANAGWRLLRTALKTRTLWALCLLAVAVLVLTNIPEVLVMLGAGALYVAYQQGRAVFGMGILMAAIQPALQTAAPAGAWDLFFYFLKIGSVLFGSGYVLIAYIQQDLVSTFRWLTAQQLLDAIAIGQVTPGPVLTTTTVVGYIVAGLPGAVLATVGIFLPAFVLVIATAPLIPRMRNNPAMSAFLAGVNAGVIAAIAVTLADLAREALRQPQSEALSVVAVLLALGSLAALIRLRLNPTWLIALGAVVGLIYGMIGG